MWDKILKFLNDNKDALGWLFGSGVILAILGGIYRLVIWLIKEYRLRRIRTNDNFPFKVILPNSNVAKEILGGADDDPLADRNIPYQQRVQGKNTRRELEELIEDNRWILIAGRTGLGKTREAVQLAQSLNNEGWTILHLTRETWLDAPAKLPSNIPERKLLFFLDDLNKKCLSSKVEVRPDASESLTLPIYEPFQTRLQRTLETFDTFCGKSEIRVIATARNEKAAEFDEPSEWEKLGWIKYKELWEKFRLVNLLEPEKIAEQKLLAETAGKANIHIKTEELPTLAKRNDGTFRNLVENLASAKTEETALSVDNFRDTLKGTWQKRYQKATQRYPEAKFIYDAVEVIKHAGIMLNTSNILSIAVILARKNFFNKIKFRWQCYFTLRQLDKTENILEPKDGQVEAKGYRIKSEDLLRNMYFEIAKEYFLKFPLTKRINHLLSIKLCSPSYFLSKDISLALFVLDNFNDAAIILNNVGNAYLKFGHVEEAIFLYDRSIKLGQKEVLRFIKKTSAFPWTNKGRALAFLKKYDEAIYACNKAIEIDKKFYLPWSELGRIYSEMHDYEKAIDSFNKAIQIKPKQAVLWVDLGFAYGDIQKNDDAIKAFSTAATLDKKWATPWNALGYVYMQLERYDEAIDAYQKAISIAPNWILPWNNLGFIYSNLHQIDKAIEICQRAIAVSPKSPSSWINLARVYAKEKRFNEAKSTYEKAIELVPQSATLWYEIGMIYSTTKDNLTALTSLQNAVRLDPQNATFRASFIGILRKLGRETEAKEEEKIARPLMDIENTYNRACFESICGNTEESLRLLKIALEENQTNLEWIHQDPDLEFIREDQRFKELVGLD